MSNCVGKKADETKPYFVLITPKLKNKISLKNRLPNEEWGKIKKSVITTGYYIVVHHL